MRVLVACEFSGIVRDAFRDAGHEAWSCDLLPTEADPAFHRQGDVRRVIEHAWDAGWDLLIAHPPCTYLANSGVRWLYGGKGTTIDWARWDLMEEAAQFFALLLDAPIPRIAVENPVMHRHAAIRRPDQIIQPWMFGHGETKATCLWLKGLPPLVPTDIVEGRVPRVHHASPGPDRWKERSRTLPGIAAAMAAQWGSPSLPEGHGAVPLDLPLGHGPRLADEPTSQPPVVDLIAQRGGRETQPLSRLREREHLPAAGERLDDGRHQGHDVSRDDLSVAAMAASGAGEGDALHRPDRPLSHELAGGPVLASVCECHLSSPCVVPDVDNLDGTAYVVKGYST